MPDALDELADDVPSPIDLRNPEDAKAWAASADAKRPWRSQLREAIASIVGALPTPRRVLELGAGPGLLAETVLRACALDTYVLFDFSAPMLEMSRVRVGAHPAATFVRGDFKHPNWSELVQGPFDAIVAMQAVHEIRHKRHVPGLYREIYRLLRQGGACVVCDHEPLDSTIRSSALYATEREQHVAFAAAGFAEIRTHVAVNGLYVCMGIRSSLPG